MGDQVKGHGGGGGLELDHERRAQDRELNAMTHSVQQTMRVDDLQIQVTKMEIQCLEERRNCLDLVGANEQLKLENEDMARKFQAALLLGKIDEGGVVHFLQRDPAAASLTDEIIKVKQDLKKFNGGKTPPSLGLDNPIVLAKQVAHLQNYLMEMKKVNLMEIFGLKTSLELTLEERVVMKEQYEARLKEVVNRLEDCRSLMHKMTEENLRVKKQLMLSEQGRQREVKKLGERLAHLEEEGGGGRGGCVLLREEGADRENGKCSDGKQQMRHKCVPPLQAHLLEKLARSEILVLEQGNTIKEYELKFLKLERKLGRVKEEEAATKKACSEMIKKLKQKNESLESRFLKLDERRKLDNSGFRSDITILRTLIKSIERKVHLFMTRKMMSAEEREQQQAEGGQGQGQGDKENINQRVPSPPERDLNFNLGRIKDFPDSGRGPKQGPDFDLRTMGPSLTTTTKRRGRQVWKKHQNEEGGVVEQRKHGEFTPEEELHLKDLDVEEERRDSREEMEKDKLIYSLLCKVLDSAKYKVNQVERGILKQVL